MRNNVRTGIFNLLVAVVFIAFGIATEILLGVLGALILVTTILFSVIEELKRRKQPGAVEEQYILSATPVKNM